MTVRPRRNVLATLRAARAEHALAAPSTSRIVTERARSPFGTAARAALTDENISPSLEHLAHRHPAVIAVARLGWVAKGIVYGLVGVLAVPIAIEGLRTDRAQDGDEEASTLGAVAAIAQTSLGAIALWIVAVGLMLYVLWRLVSIVLPAENTVSAWLTRGGYAVSVAMYSFLAWSAMSFATDERGARGAETEDAKVERFTRELMDRSAGQWLVGAIGICVVGVGIYFMVKGVRGTFHGDLEPRGVGPISLGAIVLFGRVGWVGRGVVMVLVGWFVTIAAVRFRPADAQGLDGSLREVTRLAVGPAIVGFTAVALVVYGVFCVISAPRQRLTGAD